MYNKTIIEFGFRMISWIIKTLCLYYLPQPLASADNTDLGFDNSWYHAQPHPIIVYYSSESIAQKNEVIIGNRPLVGFYKSDYSVDFNMSENYSLDTM